MNGQTVFNVIKTKPRIVRSDFRMTDDVMPDDVMSSDIIAKIAKLVQHFTKKGSIVGRFE